MAVKVFDEYTGTIRTLDEEDAKELVAVGRAYYVNDKGDRVKSPPRKKA